MRRFRWPRRVLFRLLRVLPALLLTRVALGQGEVSGEVSIIERRAGAGSRDLAGAVVYLVPAEAGGAQGSAGRGPPDSAAIAMRFKEFRPHVQVVTLPAEVAFPNDDPFSHNVFSNAPLGSFDLGLYRRGASRSAAFVRAGVYPIYCNIHARMVSFVIAVSTRHVAHADRAGRFVLPDVTAGDYVLHAWHERTGETTLPLAVPAVGASRVRLVLDARAFTAAAHPNKFGGVYTSMRADRY